MLKKEQFVQLAQQYMDTIFRLAFSYLKSRPDADDVTQTVLLRLYQSDKDFQSDCHLKHWLIRVTINECKKYWRSPWRRAEDLSDYINSLTFEGPRENDLLEAVLALDTKYRIIIYLYYYEGYTVEEIAELLKLPQGTVWTRLKRARERLRKNLSEEAST